MKKTLVSVFAIVALAMIFAGTVPAANILYSGSLNPGPLCPSCSLFVGYELGALLDENGDGIFSVTATPNINGVTPAGLVLLSMAWQLGGVADLPALVTAPGVGWNVQLGGLDASGCNASGAGFCTEGGSAPMDTPQTFSWVVTGVDVIGGEINGHLKVGWDVEGNLVSQNFILNDGTGDIPEPSTFLLLGVGLVGLAALRRRR